jgi:uncharacterized membrane protein YfcA
MVLLFAAGVGSGAVGTLAGGGAMITMPLLLGIPLPAKVVEGTVQLANLAGYIGRLLSYQRSRVLDWRAGLLAAVPVTIGAAVGARTALELSNRDLRLALLGAIAIGALILATNAQRLLSPGTGRRVHLGWSQGVLLALVGAWGGSVTVDSATFLLLALTISVGYDLPRGNAIRAIVSLPRLLVASFIYASTGHADWTAAACLASGSALSSWFAADFAIQERSKIWVVGLMFVVLGVELLRIVLVSGLTH